MDEKKAEELFTKIKNKIRRAEALHKFEWDIRSADCPYREEEEQPDWVKERPEYEPDHGCDKINRIPIADREIGYHLCRFFNCPFLK